MSSPQYQLLSKEKQAPDELPTPIKIYSNDTPCPVFMSVELANTPAELHSGLVEIAKYSPHENFVILDHPHFEQRKRSTSIQEASFEWCLNFHYDETLEEGELAVKYFPTHNNIKLQISVEYRRSIEAFKALGRLLAIAFKSRSISVSILTEKLFEELLNFRETAQFETLCLMIDCSRNAVTSVPMVFKLLRFGALLGFNMFQLYTEDTYEIKDEPYFGFCRGGYTQKELTLIDDYAFNLGIEIVPCIQTLGHLGQILQWPHFAHLRDTSEILITRMNETYSFIEKMILASSQPLRSKKIHLGMDEAYGLGEGRYRQFFGQEDNTKIFVEHLHKIKEICERLDLKPMIWSDMLFCLGAKNMSLSSYYDENIQPASINLDPSKKEELELVFWDYYHVNSDIYTQKLKNHRELGCPSPWMAAGAWTWSRFWCAMQFSIKASQACIQASKDPSDGVKKYMLTIWGDEGSESDYFKPSFSALPIMVYTSLQAYSPEKNVDIDYFEECFAGICGGNLHSWYKASQIDEIPFNNEFKDLYIVQEELPSPQFPPNTAKHILWEDPFYSILSPTYGELDLETHYTKLANSLLSSMDNSSSLYPLDHHLRLPAYLSRVVALKVNLRPMLVEYYRRGQKEELSRFASHRIGELKSALVQLWHYHRSLWHHNNKPFGWEVLELRYGGQLARLETMASRITDYCDYHFKLSRWLQSQPSLQLQDPDEMEVDFPNGQISQRAVEDISVASMVDNSEDDTSNPPGETIHEDSKELVTTSDSRLGSAFRFNSNQAVYTSTGDQLALWPDHSAYPDGTVNMSLATIPELEFDVPVTFSSSRHNMIIEYSRSSAVSRLG